MSLKKTAVLYHNDADGFASALAAWLVYGDNANYIPVRYGEPSRRYRPAPSSCSSSISATTGKRASIWPAGSCCR
ncbi:hypothetical protein A8O28_16815 [Enterobacteriaceae bacterium CCUG 67584]|nr:hypothetical protein [Enterobacteriaceae bacterium CCUG 67584]